MLAAMTSVPPLQVGRWRLRGLEPDDAIPWLAIVNEPELRRLTSWSIDTLDELQRVVADYVSGPRRETSRRFAIVDDVDGAFCGTVGFKDWDRAAHTAELSYELAADRRGRGAMSAIAAAVVDHGFEVMQLRTIRALVNVENAASNRLLEKLGFTRTGTLPRLRTCGGVLRDFYSYERRSSAPAN